MSIEWMPFVPVSVFIGVLLARLLFQNFSSTLKTSQVPQAVKPDPVEAWRADRSARRRKELDEWQVKFNALLPPKPPCISTNHEHVEMTNIAGQVIIRYCNIQIQSS